MADPTYTLQELSEESGIEARTIRSYIERDLLPGPSGMGPKASYGPEHLDRLKVIRLLRDAHRELALGQIGSFLPSAHERGKNMNKNRKPALTLGLEAAIDRPLIWRKGDSVRLLVVDVTAPEVES